MSGLLYRKKEGDYNVHQKKVMYGYYLITLAMLVSMIYFGIFLNQNSYKGVLVSKNQDKWIVSRVFSLGLASEMGIKVDDQIVKIDDKSPEENKTTTKWLVVEQNNSMDIKRENKVFHIKFGKNTKIGKVFVFTIILTFSLFFSAFITLNNGIHSKVMVHFSLFSLSLGWSILSSVASSMGDSFARLIFLSTCFLIPVLWGKIIYYLMEEKRPFFAKIYLPIVMNIAFSTIVLVVITIFFEQPFWISHYLSVSPLFFIEFVVLFLFGYFSWYQFKHKKKLLDFDFDRALLVSFLPTFMFYLTPIDQSTHFVFSLAFLSFFNLYLLYYFILIKKIHFRYKISDQFSKLLVIVYFTALTYNMIELAQFLSSLTVIFTCGVFYYYSIPLTIDFLNFNRVRNNKEQNYFSPNKGQAILIAQEREREEIAQSIHDNSIQDLTYLSRELKSKKKKIGQKELVSSIDEVIYELRKLCTDISPVLISELGLEESINLMASDMMKQHNVEIEFEEDCIYQVTVPKEIKQFIYRASKELTNNAIKHGKASEIKIIYRTTGHLLELSIEDNGTWDDSENKNHSFGLASIRGKCKLLGATLQIEHIDSTLVKLKIPLEKRRKK